MKSADAVILLTIIACVGYARAVDDQDHVCRLLPNGAKIRDPESCSRSVTCMDGIGTYTDECSGKTPYYNKESGKCVASLTDDSTCQISCTNSTGLYVADPKTCKGYYYCHDETSLSLGSCPDTTHFNETQQACIYKFESECRVHKLSLCSVVPNGVNIKDTQNCNKYYVCTKEILTQKTCGKADYYDQESGKCVAKSHVYCPVHPIPSSACGTALKPIKNKYVSDGATCRGYLFCEKGLDTNPLWGECPLGTFFSTKKQACVHPLLSECSHDRCVGRDLQFVVSSSAGCRHYLRCVDGLSQGELSCGNYFFDEEQAACVSTIIKYDACKV